MEFKNAEVILRFSCSGSSVPVNFLALYHHSCTSHLLRIRIQHLDVNPLTGAWAPAGGARGALAPPEFEKMTSYAASNKMP